MTELGTVRPTIGRADYERAERFLPWHADRLISRAEVSPRWLGGGDRFWYRVRTRDGAEYVRVDAAAGTRAPLFDHGRLASALSAATGAAQNPADLKLDQLEVDPVGHRIDFEAEGARWRADLATHAVERLGDAAGPGRHEAVSPDGQWAAFVRDHNLWLRETGTGRERALTDDGTAERHYGGPIRSPLLPAGIAKAAEAPPPAILWSPDSRRFVTHRIDERGAGRLEWLQTVPLTGESRPELHRATYPLPGDETVPGAELLVFDAESGAVVRPAVEPLPVLYYGSPLLVGPPSGVGSTLTRRFLWWSDDGSRLYAVRRDRGFQSHALHEVDPSTGAAREIARERAKSGIDPMPTRPADPGVPVLDGGRSLLWFSHRDGWGHLYRRRAGDDGPGDQLTRGPWNVAEVSHDDEAGGAVYVVGVGREAGDPYVQHLYRVPLAGGEPVRLTPEDADHTVEVSPNGRWFVDTYSRVDAPPVTVLRATEDGRVVLELERADIEPLQATGWRFPERFVAKARDGVTDVYGILLRPSRFDGSRPLPVLDYIYGGPQVNQAPVAFADLARGRSAGFWQAQALAELGFAVVMIDGLGMPLRSRAYHEVSYRNVADGGIPDHIAALRQLAVRYPYLDLDRVGIFGHSAGGYASARAILGYPAFYKAAVSSAGLHHHRWDKATWNERYSGPYAEHYEGQANTSLAPNLTGKLLLAHGEMDENVHPFNTWRLVDALIKANKNFDLILLPNRPHGCFGDPYLTRRRWDHFVRHLLGAEPPKEYAITGP